jgi:hypothetical protein
MIKENYIKVLNEVSTFSTHADTPEHNKVLSTGTSNGVTGKLHNNDLKQNPYLDRYIH